MSADDVLIWRLTAYGNIIRGDDQTSEDQIGYAMDPSVARRLVACWNACSNVSLADLESGDHVMMPATCLSHQSHI